MKKFSFSLQKIIEIKEQILENLKIELSSLNDELMNIDSVIKKLKMQFSDTDKEFITKSSTAISVGEMAYYKMLMNSILKQIDNKEEEKEIVLKQIDAKRNEIVDLNKELSSLDKLRENELDKYNKAILKSEEIFIDEFVSNKSMSKKYAI